MKNTNFKLSNGKKDFNLPLLPVTGKTYFEFAEVFDTLPENPITRYQQLMSKVLLSVPTNSTQNFETNFQFTLQSALASGAITIQEFSELLDVNNQKKSTEFVKQQFLINIELVKIIADTSNLNIENRKLVESDSTSDFWMNQNPKNLELIVDSFRSSI